MTPALEPYSCGLRLHAMFLQPELMRNGMENMAGKKWPHYMNSPNIFILIFLTLWPRSHAPWDHSGPMLKTTNTTYGDFTLLGS